MCESTVTSQVRCPSCRQEWASLDDFLSDPQQSFLGYQAHFRAMTCGFFLFNHLRCKTTLGIEVDAFTRLTAVQVFNRCQRGTEKCPQFCLHHDQLVPSADLCECEFVQEVMSVVTNWPKAVTE